MQKYTNKQKAQNDCMLLQYEKKQDFDTYDDIYTICVLLPPDTKMLEAHIVPHLAVISRL